MKDKRNLLKWIGGALILGFLFWHPITRQVMIFLLPLGSGFDDLIALACIVFAIVGAVLYYTNGKFWIFERKQHGDDDSGLESFDVKKGK
jgi:hypothetical protein